MKITGETIFIHVPLEKQNLIFAWKKMLFGNDINLKKRIIELIEIDLKYMEGKNARTIR